jgi:predicted AAA+ superfamily ATPase
MINRILARFLKKSTKSVLLLGPRQVGKSTLIQSIGPDLTISFADQAQFVDFASDPDSLRKAIETSNAKSVFIDEVQRLPSVLNTVQFLIDQNKSLKFYLTGSSARKLKRGRANLLPGRIFSYQMGPFVSAEFSYELDTKRCLSIGTLPEVYLSTKAAESKRNLQSYVNIYLKEEIQAEAVSRDLEGFSRFLKTVIADVGQFIDYSKLAKRAKISRHSCARHFEVLEDTLIGYRLHPFQELEEAASLIKHPKFYFFDTGVLNGMLQNFVPSMDRMGILSEQLVFSQLFHSANAFGRNIEISTFRTRGGVEVDFICKIEKDVFAIEVKSSDNIHSADLYSVHAFKKSYAKKHACFIFHMGDKRKKIENIWCLPWQEGLKEIGL